MIKRSKICFVLLALAFAFQSFYLMGNKSPVTDAVSFHLVNGYTYLKTQDFRMSPATPPLIREWMALPWLIKNPEIDLNHASWDEADSVPFAKRFFYQNHRSSADVLLFYSRVMTFVLALFLGVLIWIWAKQLYGPLAAGMASMLYFFSPTIVGYSALANIEIGIALFYSLTIYLMWKKWCYEKKRQFPIMAAVAFGLALASKYTAVLLGPVILLLAIRQLGFRRGLMMSVGVFFVALSIVWATYFFEFKPLLQNVPRLEEKEMYITQISAKLFGDSTWIQQKLISAAHSLPIPLSTWILGFAGIARSHQEEYRHFFMGTWSNEQVWYHYLVSFVTKVTLPLLLLIGLRVTSFMKSGLREAGSLYLLSPVIFLFAMTTIDTTGVGMRYLIPTMPFIFIWLSGIFIASPKENKSHNVMKFTIVFLTLAHCAFALHQFPNYVSYFNQLIGGPKQAHHWFRANDLEWGQEVKNLGKYVQKNNITSIRTDLFGTRDESYYGIPHQTMRSEDLIHPSEGWYAISVFSIDNYAWTKGMEPKARIGNTIWVYEIGH